MGKQTISLTLNGQSRSAEAWPGERLSEALRERFGAREVKVGCGAGDCGACTVLLDGMAVCACLVPVTRAAGRSVTTAGALRGDDRLGRRLRDAFVAQGAAQCGACIPGMLVTASALLAHNPQPNVDEVRDALGGVLCRCTGYQKIVAAVLLAASDDPIEIPRAVADREAVGQAIARMDADAKVSGDAFGDDVAPAGTLLMRIVRSPYDRAQFTFGELSRYVDAVDGVVAVLTAEDIPGRNAFGIFPQFTDQPVFAERETRFRGEAVAAVVGERDVVADLDLDEFPVTWTELPAVLTSAPAREESAPLVHAGREGNVLIRGYVETGDVDRTLPRLECVQTEQTVTSFVEHAYIEPEAGFAQRTDAGVEVHACTQAPYLDRDSVAEILGLAPAQVRIVPTAVGGGFGSKLDVSVQPFLALAAWKLNRPVRIAYSRRESMQSTTKRHASAVDVSVGADAAGRIVAIDFRGQFNTGAYASWGPTVADRVPIHASGPYRVPHYRARSEAVHTHTVPAGAFRGFGVPQACFAVELAIDGCARKLGRDPLEFRLQSALVDGDCTATGQRLDAGVGMVACLEALRPHWTRAKSDAAGRSGADARYMYGVGVAAGWYGCGNTSVANPSTIRAGITPTGEVVLHQGAMDMGQGPNTVIAQIFADALGVPLDQVRVHLGSTDETPDAGKSSASRQTYVSGNAAKLAGQSLREQIIRQSNLTAAATISISAGEIVVTEDDAVRRIDLADLSADASGYVLQAEGTYDPPTTPSDAKGQGSPYAVYGYAAQMAEVEVDTKLGIVRVHKITAAHDVGRAINPILAEGQIQGGIAQGLGMAMMEEHVPGRTENLHDYLIPTIGDMPEIECILVEVPDPHGPYGAKGLGEHALVPTAPAIINAIRDATQALIRQLPATPDKVLREILAVERSRASAGVAYR